MATYDIRVSGKGLRQSSVMKVVENERLVAAATSKTPISVSVTKVKLPESRADRFAEAVSNIEDAVSELESLRDELQEWRDNLPENLQDGDKANQLDEAIGELEQAIDSANEAAGCSVEFPSMY